MTLLHPLLAPMKFPCGASAPNHVWLAPMTNMQSHPDGTLSDDELRWLVRRADGGFGVIATCAAHVAADGQGWPGELGIFADRHVDRLRELATAIRGKGSFGMVQLFHGGLRADPKLTGEPTWSASAVEADARAATDARIVEVIDQFRAAAVRAVDAGFEGVELHGAHGYLLCQFLSATQNQRVDRWGGPFEHRARLLRETLRAVRAAVPPRFVVGVRISPEDRGNAKGLDLDESLQLARWLADDGADFLHLSLWNASKPTVKRPEVHPIAVFREAVPKLPLVVAGGIWTAAEARAAVELGADAIALGRAAILNPDWPRHLDEPRWEPKRPPATIDELHALDLSPTFATYMRQWKGFVAD
jgi:2,4-dienoyl-CoA reductase-like NADH-dependent reductase (Old Yellow Enzyme family)